MPRTAVPVGQCPAYGQGLILTGGTAGDGGNGNVVVASSQPDLVIMISNAHTSDIDVTFNRPPTSYNSHVSGLAVTRTIPAAAAGIEGIKAFVFDAKAWAVTTEGADNGVQIDSADGNYNLCTLYAYTWESDSTYR